VGVEELGLGLAAVGSFAIPPLGAVAIDRVARGASDRDTFSASTDQRARPLGVLEGGSTGEGDSGAVGSVRKVESLSSWDSDAAEGNGRTVGDLIGDIVVGGESTATTLLHSRSGSDEGSAKNGGGKEVDHDDGLRRKCCFCVMKKARGIE